jgi:hypothetical protein
MVLDSTSKITICRFRFPKKLYPEACLDIHGIVHLARNDHMINHWNPTISSVLRSNHDISFIPSASKTLASVFYMTNYATKDDIKLHQVVMMGAILKLSLEQQAQQIQSVQGAVTQNIQQSQYVQEPQRVD